MKAQRKSLVVKPKPSQLLDWMVLDLEKSGLTPENFHIEVLESEAELEERLGFSSIPDKSSNWIKLLDHGGYWIRYPMLPIIIDSS